MPVDSRSNKSKSVVLKQIIIFFSSDFLEQEHQSSIRRRHLFNLIVEDDSSHLASFLSVGVCGVAQGTGDWSGYDVLQVSVIPEPSTYAVLFGGLALLAAGYRRFRRKN
jgi:hypothetical protein